MSLPGTPESLARLLDRKFTEEVADNAQSPLANWTIKTISASEMLETLTNHITIFTYCIELDPTRRHDELPPTSPGQPSRLALALDLRVLLTVWGTAASGELQVLGKCMEILDEHPVLTGDDLDPRFTWYPGAAIRVGIDTLPTENLLQLWDALSPSFRLSVPYRLRTVRLSARTTSDQPLVDAVTRRYGQAGT